jgi:protein disulfide-isomerase
MNAMRTFFILVLLALAGAGAYGYYNNPVVCQKLGNEVAADLVIIFTPGSGKNPPTTPAGATAAISPVTSTQPMHWKQGFVTENDPSSQPVPDAQPAVPTTAIQPAAPAPQINQVYKDSDFADLGEATEASRARHRPIVILFTGSDWCPYCQSLESEVMSTGQFEQYKDSHFVLVTVDDLRNGAMLDDDKTRVKTLETQFHISSFPTLVVLDSTQKELGRVEGYAPGSGLAAVQDGLGKYLGN